MSGRLLLSFYGDDLTGSCDAMEALALGGAPTALFFEPPSPELLRERFPGLQAVGVAGVSRTMTPAQMDETLPYLDDARLEEAGRLIWSQRGDTTLFVTGSSGVEYALSAHWRNAGVIPRRSDFSRSVATTKQIIVVSGSCSLVTGGQIEWAFNNGFA